MKTRRANEFLAYLIVLSAIVFSSQINARNIFPPEMVGFWNAFSRTAQPDGNATITASKISFANGLEIVLSPIGTRRGVSLAPGNPPAELFRISSIHHPPLERSDMYRGPPGSYVSLFWRKMTLRELLMITMTRGEHSLRGQILTITILTGKSEPAGQLNARGLQADFVYVR